MRIAVLFLVLVATSAYCAPVGDTVSLAGEWRFDLDPKNVGITERWFAKDLSDTVKLPGSTDTNRKGVLNTRPPDLSHLARVYEYSGAAWYQRDITIPEEWRGRRIVLFLERCHWETQVWIDGRWYGMEDSLVAPHVHNLGTDLRPGTHRLTIRVDNTIKYNVGGWAHSITEETQTNWNGIIGRIELQVRQQVGIGSVQIYPDVAKKTIRVKAFLLREKDKPCRLSISVLEPGNPKPIASKIIDDTGSAWHEPIEATLPMPANVRLWDEFSPNLYDLAVSVVSGSSWTEWDSLRTTFGMRDLRVQDKRLVMNGRRIFLRGTLECCIFPLTGYPPTDVDSWLRILKICKSYGLNHMRFHSWCPPDAAFEAADRMGFLFQVELPQWVGDVGKDAPRDDFIRGEMMRILNTYGNHPSFGMLCMGNELQGDAAFLQKLVLEGKAHDSRHLYTSSDAWLFGPNDDYNVAAIRGLHGPTTDKDFGAQDAESKVPIVSHEIGQWSVFPSMAEISKYTGVTRARNFELIRDGLKEHGLLDQAADLTRASGKLSAELYKEEIEGLLRTQGHGGFQLLDLHDFPGQGTATIGMLDAFWDSKGLIKPEDWRRFCGPTVPLLRMTKRTWTTDETFTATAQIAHFGPKDFPDAVPIWSIRDEKDKLIASGSLPEKALPTGDLHDLGTISASLAEVHAPSKLTVTLSLKGTDISNNWAIWVYPAKVDLTPPSDVLVTRNVGEAKSALDAGKKVLLLASRANLVDPGTGSPTTIFWDPVLFTQQSNNGMGIICDPKHPALAGFPTEFHANWQWWELLDKSLNMVLDGTPRDFHPIVQVIDNYIKNRRMGNLIEARVGQGRLIVCSMNIAGIEESRLAPRQMLRSILDYMSSPAFQPKQALTLAELDTFLRQRKPSVLRSLGARVAYVDSEDVSNPAANAIDDDPDTIWHTEWQGASPPFPHEIQIDLRTTAGISGFKYLPRQDMTAGWFTGYEFYVSDDGKDWRAPVAKGTFPSDNKEKVITLDTPARGRFIRLVALKGYGDNPWAGIAELDVLK